MSPDRRMDMERIAALIGQPARAAMLGGLLTGRSLTATECWLGWPALHPPRPAGTWHASSSQV